MWCILEINSAHSQFFRVELTTVSVSQMVLACLKIAGNQCEVNHMALILKKQVLVNTEHARCLLNNQQKCCFGWHSVPGFAQRVIAVYLSGQELVRRARCMNRLWVIAETCKSLFHTWSSTNLCNSKKFVIPRTYSLKQYHM